MAYDAEIPLEQLAEPHDAMRFEMDDEKMEELIDSIRVDGIINRLSVVENHFRAEWAFFDRPGDLVGEGEILRHRYEVRAGHRRLLACRALKFSPVPCKVFVPSDAAYERLMAVENLIREEPSVLEEANLFKRVKDEPGITEQELQRRCGKKLSYIYKVISIAEGDQNIALALHRKQISMGVALKLNQIKYPPPGMHGEKLVGEALQNAIATADVFRAMMLERAVNGGCSIAQAESYVAQYRTDAGIVVVSPLPPAEPMPPGGYPVMTNVCALCGERDRQEEMEGVYVHRDELVAIRAAMKANAGG